MMFHRLNAPYKVCSRFTAVETMVFIEIALILVLIFSSAIIEAKKSILSQYCKNIPDVFHAGNAKKEKNDAVRKEDISVKAGRLNSLKGIANGSGSTDSSMGKTPEKKSKHRRADDTDGQTLSGKGESGIVFPEPTGILPGKMKVTVINLESSETEPFAKFLFEKGSGISPADYRKALSCDINKLKWKRSLKLDRNIKVSPFDQAIRDETVYLTSPYRTYALRKRLLNASRLIFDPEKSKMKQQKIAEQNFHLAKKWETVEIDLPSEKVSGTFKGIKGKHVLIGTSRIRIDDIPEDQRWRFDEEALNKKIAKFTEKSVQNEERELNKKQDEYIQKILAAEFPMLKDDFWMKNIPEMKK